MREKVTEHEATFLGGMRVEVNVDVEVPLNICIMQNGFLNCPYCGLVVLAWIQVESI